LRAGKVRLALGKDAAPPSRMVAAVPLDDHALRTDDAVDDGTGG
jgi:hypothetical protein